MKLPTFQTIVISSYSATWSRTRNTPIPQKSRLLPITRRTVTSQKSWIFSNTDVKASNFTLYYYWLHRNVAF